MEVSLIAQYTMDVMKILKLLVMSLTLILLPERPRIKVRMVMETSQIDPNYPPDMEPFTTEM